MENAKVICKKCGKTISGFNRFCQTCGTSIYLSLDSPNLESESIYEIFRSIHNLLQDRDNPERGKYLSKEIENIVFKRTERISGEILGFLWEFRIDSNLANIFKSYNSNALAGYAVRVAEELRSGKKSPALNIVDIKSLIKNFIEKGKAEYRERFLYPNIDTNNPVFEREIFCFALTWDNEYEKYFLEDKNEMENLMNFVADKEIEYTSELIERVSLEAYNTLLFGKLASTEKSEQEIVTNFLFGYCLRLSENLYP